MLQRQGIGTTVKVFEQLFAQRESRHFRPAGIQVDRQGERSPLVKQILLMRRQGFQAALRAIFAKAISTLAWSPVPDPSLAK